MPLNLEALFYQWKKGAGISLDEKLSILEHYNIKFPKRELARELSNVVGNRVRLAKEAGYTDAMKRATKEDAKIAIRKLLDKHLKEAEGRFIVERQKELRKKELEEKHGKEAAKKAIERQLWIWISVGDGNVCPQCKERHGQKRTIKEWTKLGLPRTGATYCKQYCRCRLNAYGDPGGEKPTKPPTEIPPTGEETRKELEKKVEQGARLEKELMAEADRISNTITNIWKENAKEGLSDEHIDQLNLLGEKADRILNKIETVKEKLKKTMYESLKAKNPLKYKLSPSGAKHISSKIHKKAKEAIGWLETIVDRNAGFLEGEELNILVKGNRGRRAWCKGSTICVRSSDPVSTYVHEMGHALEHKHKGILGAAKDFLDRRAKEDPDGLVALSKITGISYGRNERAWKDKFIDPYMGKYYAEATEIVSMGLQMLYANPSRLLKEDPKYFEFILNIVRGHF